jgi:hypothetical protein
LIDWVKFCHLVLLFAIGQLSNFSTTLFADDPVIIKDIYHPANEFCELNNDLETINSWSKQWRTTINAEKMNYLIFSEKPNKCTHPPLP